jgi:hypothetical protein
MAGKQKRGFYFHSVFMLERIFVVCAPLFFREQKPLIIIQKVKMKEHN